MTRSARGLAIGVDVGGTWTRVLAHAPGRRRVGAAVRLAAIGDLRRSLSVLWRERRWSGRNVAAMVIASKGLWTPAECARVARRFARFARHVQVIPDAQAAALGALDGQAGVLILSGTGSIVVGHNGRRRWERAGGLGALLGDEGSGFWLGREWIRATTGPGDFAKVRTLAHAAQPTMAIAALAPMVLARARRGDRRALRIARAGQAHLAAAAIDVARRLRLAPPVSMSWAGSVLGDPWFRAGVARAVRRGGLGARWIEPTVEPVVAAARLAAELAASRGAIRRAMP
jgi:N-acetylglucosamine kinase-like BadF-type ATPase